MGCETIKDIQELECLKKELATDQKNVNLLLKNAMLLFDPFMDMDQTFLCFDKSIDLEPDNPYLFFLQVVCALSRAMCR